MTDKWAEKVVDCASCDAPCCKAFTMGSFAIQYQRPVGLAATPAAAAIRMSEEWEEYTGGRAMVRLAQPDMHPSTLVMDDDDPWTFTGLEVPRLRCTAQQGDGRCGVYSVRPVGCRIYDCRTDPIRQLEGENARCTWPRDLGSADVDG